MSRFSKVERRMWRDEKFRALSAPAPNAQTLWQYLLTGPQNTTVPGLFVCGVATIADELGWPAEDTRRCFDEILAAGMARFDPATRLVWLPNALRHNAPANPNVVVGWRDEWNLLPECSLKTEARRRLESELRAIGEAFALSFSIVLGKSPPRPSPNPSGKGSPKGPPKPLVKGSPKQEQEQEQEQEQTQTGAAAAALRPVSPPRPPSPAREVFDHWRAVMGSPRSVLDAKRERAIAAAIERHGLADCKRAVDGCFASDWHMNRPGGGNDRGKRFNDIELILRDAKHVEEFLALVALADERPAAKAAATPPADLAAFKPYRPVSAPAVRAAREARVRGGDDAAPAEFDFSNLLDATGDAPR